MLLKQINFLDNCTEPTQNIKKPKTIWKLFIDGASRNNPGKAGAGIYLLKNDEKVIQKGYFLGIKTNNEAEYLALLLGIFHAKKVVSPSDILYISSDSQLLIRQLKGEYSVRKAELKVLYTCALEWLAGMNYSVCHIKRELNEKADNLANKGIDDEVALPQGFKALLHERGFSFS